MTRGKLAGLEPTAFHHHHHAAELQLWGAGHHQSRKSKTKFNHMTTKVVGLPVIYPPAAPGDHLTFESPRFSTDPPVQTSQGSVFPSCTWVQNELHLLPLRGVDCICKWAEQEEVTRF